jgi:type II secretory pathway component GspD/PulD (secretin)
MNTFLRIFSLLLACGALLGARAALAIDETTDDVLSREQQLVSDVEVTLEDEPEEEPGIVDKLIGSDDDEDEPEEELEEIPVEIGDKEGFWDRVLGAFEKAAPQTEPENRMQVEANVLMVEGRELFRRGNYREALETFKDLLQRDPYNITARRYVKECQEQLMNITLDDLDIVRRERLQDVDRNWLMQTRQEREIEDVVGAAAAMVERPIDRNIQQVLESVRFTEAKLPVVFDYLFQTSEPKVSIVTDPGAMKALEDAGQDTITLQLQTVPLLEVIKFICKTKGLTYRVDENAVVISGKESVRLRSKVFQLSRSLDMIELPDVEGASATKKAQALFEKIGVSDVEGARVTYNTRRNQLFVRNTDANLKIIEEFLGKYDKTPYQVQIESRFVTIQNDNMSELVFRYFLTRNYRWNRNDKYGDRYYLEAPNRERELTPGLRYIRSYMNEDSFNPLLSAYQTPDLVSTGDAYDDYLRERALRPHQASYLERDVESIDNLYAALEQQKALVNQSSRQASSEYATYQNFVKQFQPILIDNTHPQYDLTVNEMQRLWDQYTNTVSLDLLPDLTQLDNLRESLQRERALEKTVNDGIGKVFDISGVIGPADYRAVIYALDNAEGVEMVFAPKVTVVNGQRAEIKDVTRIRYNKTIEEAEDQDVDVGDAYSVVYDYAVTPKEWDEREYGTRLIVTPSVQTDERTIELDVQPEVSTLVDFREFVASRNNVYALPQFFVQSVKTTVTINDGDTLVMGGLMRDRLIRTLDKVPIFGDLPLVGRYFRGESEVAKKSNLMVFITARLIDPSGQTRRALAAR